MTAYPTLQEHFYSGEFLLREAPGTISRDVVTFDNTTGALDLLVPGGTVFSFEAPSTAAHAAAGNTGTGVIADLQTNLIAALLGAYLIIFTGATTFGVAGPDGSVLAEGEVGTPYFDGVSFLITAGGTPFVAGDSGTITLAQGLAPVYAATEGNTGNGTVADIGALMSSTTKSASD